MSVKGRGRPRRFVRGEVLEQVVDVFLMSGFKGATLAELSAATGMSRPSLRLAFGDKQDLLCAAVAHHQEKLRSALRKLGREPLQDAVIATLRDLVAVYVRRRGPCGCLLLAAMPAVRGRHRRLDAAITAARQEIHDAFAARFSARSAGASGQHGPALARACVAATVWLAIEARAGASRERLNHDAEAVIRAMLAGCGAANETADRDR